MPGESRRALHQTSDGGESVLRFGPRDVYDYEGNNFRDERSEVLWCFVVSRVQWTIVQVVDDTSALEELLKADMPRSRAAAVHVQVSLTDLPVKRKKSADELARQKASLYVRRIAAAVADGYWPSCVGPSWWTPQFCSPLSDAAPNPVENPAGTTFSIDTEGIADPCDGTSAKPRIELLWQVGDLLEPLRNLHAADATQFEFSAFGSPAFYAAMHSQRDVRFLLLPVGTPLSAKDPRWGKRGLFNRVQALSVLCKHANRVLIAPQNYNSQTSL